MAIKATTFRLEDSDLDQLNSLGYETASLALKHVMDGYFVLRKVCLQNIKGIFTREELKAMLEKQRDQSITPEYRPSWKIYVIGLEDFENLENGVTRNGAVLGTLYGKIENLNPYQMYFLQEEIERFWKAPNVYSNVEEFISKFQ